ncbi:MAG: hypothetical protein KME64_25155 [Scytonematopsis contorta HA4267-MV1]|jgi:hypothetical protein|nr:hypothetical protein [Scytonematopsis contorta HA4267-MV1]
MSNIKDDLQVINTTNFLNANNNFDEVLRKIALGIFFIQILLFIIYLFSYYISAETPLVVWDALSYYLSAINIFQQNSLSEALNAIRNSDRPVFAWVSIFLIKLLELNLSYVFLSFINIVFYHIVLVASVCYLLKSVKANLLTILATISTFYSIPIFFNMSRELMGDIPTASWVMLFIAALVAIKKSAHRLLNAFFLGIIAAFGLQTKPIFIFCFVILTTCFVVVEFSRAIFLNKIPFKKICSNALPVLIVSSISFCCCLYFIYPLKLSELIVALSYNNETLGYWVSATGIFNSWLWFPKAFFEEVNILPAFILSFIFIVQLVKAPINSLIIREENNLLGSVRMYLKKILVGELFFINLSFIIFIIYVSLFVKSKDARVLFFLFPLFITLSLSIIDSVGKLSKFNNKIAMLLLVSILISNMINTMSWSPAILSWIPSKIFNSYLKIENGEISSKYPYVFKDITYENLKIPEVLDFLEKDCQPECLKNPHFVFLPHSGWTMNDNVFSSFKPITTNISIHNRFNKPPLFFLSGLFNYGGWGYEGGIPRMFLNAHYILVVKNKDLIGDLKGNTEVYNRVLAKELSSETPEFMDGLAQVFEVKNKLGDLIIYKRKKLPSPDNFVKIVQNLALKDPNNLWNVPFIYSALQINPQIPELKQQLEQMPKLINTTKYRYGTPEQEAKIRDMLAVKKDVNKYQVKYPEFLKQW